MFLNPSRPGLHPRLILHLSLRPRLFWRSFDLGSLAAFAEHGRRLDPLQAELAGRCVAYRSDENGIQRASRDEDFGAWAGCERGQADSGDCRLGRQLWAAKAGVQRQDGRDGFFCWQRQRPAEATERAFGDVGCRGQFWQGIARIEFQGRIPGTRTGRFFEAGFDGVEAGQFFV